MNRLNMRDTERNVRRILAGFSGRKGKLPYGTSGMIIAMGGNPEMPDTLSADEFPVIETAAAFELYGSDKPDLTNILRAYDATPFFLNTEGLEGIAEFYANAAKEGHAVRLMPGYNMGGGNAFSYLPYAEAVFRNGIKSFCPVTWFDNGQPATTMAMALGYEKAFALRDLLVELNAEDMFFLMCGEKSAVNTAVSYLRFMLGRECRMYEEDVFRFCWVGNKNENPTLVCNGIEIRSGNLENRAPLKSFDVKKAVMELAAA